MFGLFVSAETKDVARRLMETAESTLSKYRHFKPSELSAVIEREFPEELRQIQPHYINFILMTLPEFVFSIKPERLDSSPDTMLSIHGRQKYRGFGLDGGSTGWLSSATDGSYGPATQDAKRLAAWLERNHGAKDISKFANELWR